MLSRVWKIQNTHRIRPMEINEALDPVSPIGHRADSLGLAYPASSHLHFCHIRKGIGIGHARKVGHLAGMHLALSLYGRLFFDLTDCHSAYLGPLPFDQWD